MRTQRTINNGAVRVVCTVWLLAIAGGVHVHATERPDPVELVEPAEPTGSVDPVDSVEPSEPVEPTGPTGSSAAEDAIDAIDATHAGIATVVEEYRRQHLPAGDIVLGVSRGGTVSWFTTGVLGADTPVEIGSVTKALVGMLMAAEIAAGEVTPETTVAQLWPRPTGSGVSSDSTDSTDSTDTDEPPVSPQASVDRDSNAARSAFDPDTSIPTLPPPLASVTVSELATHTSGLSRMPGGMGFVLRSLLHLNDPYRGITPTDVLSHAASASLDERGTFAYSNLGMALLGVLLVEPWSREGPYDEALEQEISTDVLAPLGLTAFSFGDYRADAGDRADGDHRADGGTDHDSAGDRGAPVLPKAYAANGRRAQPWTFDGYAAAGAAVATPRSLMELAASLASLPSSLAAAVEPHASVDDEEQVGYGWFLDTRGDGGRMIWHNGRTGAFSSFVGAAPADGTFVVAAANAAVPLDGLARAVLHDPVAPNPTAPPTPGVFLHILAAVIIVSVVLYPLRSVVRRRVSQWRIAALPGDWWEIADRTIGHLFAVAVWARMSPAGWYHPTYLFALLFAVAVGAVLEVRDVLRSRSDVHIWATARTGTAAGGSASNGISARRPVVGATAAGGTVVLRVTKTAAIAAMTMVFW